jgi:hypothetical protein
MRLPSGQVVRYADDGFGIGWTGLRGGRERVERLRDQPVHPVDAGPPHLGPTPIQLRPEDWGV